MKKNYFIPSLLMLSLVSCNDVMEDSQIGETPNVLSEQSNKRSYEEALLVAQQSISMLDDNSSPTRAEAQSRYIDLDKSTAIISSDKTLTRSSDADNDTLMYVFNFNDNQGFAIVSAEKATEGLIAVTESGCYNPSDSTDTGFNRYMAAAKQYILANKNKENPNPERAQVGQLEMVDTIGVYNISPRITVKWGQTGHEGEYCSNGHSGCSVTAAAMIMSYFEYPTEIQLTYNGQPYSYRNLNWTGMKSYISVIEAPLLIHNCDTCTNDDHKSIGHLCRQLGKLTGSIYNNGDTETSVQTLRNVISNLGYTIGDYTSYEYLANTNTLENLLSDGKLIYMRGENINGEGHAWAIDGIYRYTVHYRWYEYEVNNEFPEFPILTLIDEQYNTYRYNHINWGFDGYNNGYYNDGVFSFYGYAYGYDDNTRIYHTTIQTLIQNDNYCDDLKFFSVYYNN